jgi:hypothetical protein
MRISGAPRFSPGEEALLFLRPAEDGTYGILHLMLGAFHAQGAGTAAIAEQRLEGAHRLGPGGEAGEPQAVRDLGRFTAWLADRAIGVERAADYWTAPPEGAPRVTTAAHTLLTTPDSVPPRWFEFDSGHGVGWNVHSAGQPGLGLEQTVASFQAAIAAWTADPTSSIDYVYTGLTGAMAGLSMPDEVNAVLFDDPNDEVPGKFDCKKGGVAAIGGPYFWTSTGFYGGRQYHESFEADIVTNDGAACFFDKNPQGAAEVFTHELGHTLGFGHATDSQAVMWAKAHDDGRGARLADDDRMGASVVYGDGSYQPAPKPTPAGPLTAQASASKTEIQISWTNPFDTVAGFRVETQKKKGVFQVLMTTPAGESSATVKGLKPNRVYVLRVTAVGPDGTVAGSSNVVRVRTTKK